jgi:2-iminobutanoate/2-iminopropanoate deaminase
LGHVLEAAESSLTRVLKTTVFLLDMAEFSTMNSAYASFFPHEPPARSTVAVAALPKGGRVEIDVIAAVLGASGA